MAEQLEGHPGRLTGSSLSNGVFSIVYGISLAAPSNAQQCDSMRHCRTYSHILEASFVGDFTILHTVRDDFCDRLTRQATSPRCDSVQA
jgi:hypothetical protein